MQLISHPLGGLGGDGTLSDDDLLPSAFRDQLAVVAAAYLREVDPLRQSGYAGGPVRWRAERACILEAIDGDGDLLDLGCANGYLLESLVTWGAERGRRLTPFGLDLSAELIALARARFPYAADHFWVADAWSWKPPARFQFVYSLEDLVPPELFPAYIARLFARVVAPGGRLILGSYGSRTHGQAPTDLGMRLETLGYRPLGTTWGGDPTLTCIAWLAA